MPLLLLLLAPGEALGAATPTIATDTTPLSSAVRNGASDAATKHSSSGGAFVRLIVGLFIVLAVIYGIYWLLKTYSKSKKGGGVGGAAGIDVVATTAIGPNRSLHLVRVGDEFVLVGAAEQTISQLRTWNADESRKLEQQLDNEGGSLRALTDRSTSGAPPLLKLMDELRKRTLR